MTNDPQKILQSKSREAALKDLAAIIAKWMMETGWFSTCLNCVEWSDENEICMKFKTRPPAKVIVSGCEHHSDIPF